MFIFFEALIVLLLSAASFLLLGITLDDIIVGVKGIVQYATRKIAERRSKRKLSLKKQIDILVQNKKSNFLVASFNEARNILTFQKHSDRMDRVYAISGFCGVAGVMIALMVENFFLLPTLAIGMTMIPIWIIKMSRGYVRKSLNDELEIALSGVTTSYMRTDNIIVAVEENLGAMNNPVKAVFSTFYNEYKFVNSNVVSGVKKMKASINQDVFSEWCDTIIQCQTDRTLKVALFPIINKFSDVKSVQSELDTLMMEPFREFITMVVVLLLIFPLLFVLGREWFDILVGTTAGQVIVSLTFLVIFVGVNKAVNLSAPIEYRR